MSLKVTVVFNNYIHEEEFQLTDKKIFKLPL